jgi:hypothetical protein
VHCDRAAGDCKALCDELPITGVEPRAGADERRSRTPARDRAGIPCKDTPTAARLIASVFQFDSWPLVFSIYGCNLLINCVHDWKWRCRSSGTNIH